MQNLNSKLQNQRWENKHERMYYPKGRGERRNMKNVKPKVLGVVETQTHKTYGIREGGKSRIEDHSKDPLPPIYENVAVCWSCGKTEHVNICGFCERCWQTFSHLRGGKIRNGKSKF